MKVKLILLIFLFTSLWQVNAQKAVNLEYIRQLANTDLEEANSQINLWLTSKNQKITVHDSSELLFFRAYILVNLGFIDSALNLFNECAHYSDRNHQYSIKILSHCEIGNIYYNWGKYDKALNYFLKAQKESLINNDIQGQAEALNYIGKYHHSLGNFDKSMEYFNKAFILAQRYHIRELQATLKANIGKYYESIGNYDDALSNYMQALKLKDSIQNRMVKGTIYNHLGNLYQAIGNYEQSLIYHKLGLNERRQLRYVEGISKSYKNIGEVYLDLKLPDTAMYYFRQALYFSEKVNYQKGIIKSLLDIGAIYLQKNNFTKARDYSNKALKLAADMGYDKGIIQANFNIGQSYLNENLLAKAEPYFTQSMQIATMNGMKEEICDNSFSLYQITERTGNPIKALEYLKKYYDTKMAIVNEQTSKHIAEMEHSYEMEQKEKANELLRKQNEINMLTIARKNGFISLISIILGLTLFVIFAFYLRYTSKQKTNKQLALLNTEIVRQNRELTRLNEQLNVVNHEKDNFFSIIAHEVRNPLWWFRNLAETLSENYDKMPKEKLGKAIQSLDESAKNSFHLMDNLLQWSKSQLNRMSFHPQELNLTEQIDENLKLWKTAANYKNIEIRKNAGSNLKLFADKDMINTIIRNLLSNAIKYTHPNGIIEIEAYQKDSTIFFKVKDSGIGIPKSNLKKLFDPNHQFSTMGIMQEKGSGIGLKLCKDFVELNHGTIDVESIENQGTYFCCSFPGIE
ncbi:MAG TPA: hypothetical protein DCQ26_17015 [Marinilabiliales bacterium]|nr:MAG: hypothetical protein A2W84_16335 [Bacteroidetes bacterium GWC2_40_13]OFX74268.1 MAG: hypothetical protein A2W96_03230 [Bacteroidetes bacterium GWD2_40_43]OFX92780.1 MAG: hypothetical protein A2W97_00480 [Bacteroidetes bacterium GWE2_40_63]OFY23172.1 MAG: hypothetical protein A2W88_12365 [Bacteroidetes bacterium GWF2_40_13]OFZ27791.1 MAG: hypothetical protein A2437_01095 [Bacteroidetes bacterium RIFOXYC2_FULL_40_12]HAN00297.1 hypothetical protein [Marinilabiliales bacterium]